MNKQEKRLPILDANKETYLKNAARKYEGRIDNLKYSLEKHETSVTALRGAYKASDFSDIERYSAEVEQIEEALKNADAFDSYYRLITDEKDLEKLFSEFDNVVDVVLKDDVDVDGNLREIANFLRKRFAEAARAEVKAGKLKESQYLANMMDYFPHIATPEGQRLFDDPNRVKKIIENFGSDYGFGRVFNPHGKSRTLKIYDEIGNVIDKPTNQQVNDFFKSELKGKNVFSDSVLDVYVSRMLKHGEIMYDDALTKSMLEDFGKPLNKDLSTDVGYKNIMNYGMLRNKIKSLTQMEVKLEISAAIEQHFTPKIIEGITGKAMRYVEQFNLVPESEEFAHFYKKKVSELIVEESRNFMKANYTKESLKVLFDDSLNSVSGSLGLKEMLEDFSMPMCELDSKQIKSFNNLHEKLCEEYYSHIKNKLINFEKFLTRIKNGKEYKVTDSTFAQIANKIDEMTPERLRTYLEATLNSVEESDIGRVKNLIRKLDYYDKNLADVPQIKQVHEVVADKVNQARKIQIIKDQNRMLMLYDKMTHFIKLNQTTVLPSFHARNKISNTFNNWIVTGNDALNWDMQKSSFLAMYHKGDKGKLSGVEDLVIKVGTGNVKVSWSELYELAERYGVIDKGYFAKDLGVGKDTSGVIKKLSAKYDPTDTKNFVWYKKGAEIGSVVENQDRLLHFASQLKQGKTYKEAAESVTKTLFDYSDLTAFEASVMKRILPYYTWLRKNSMLQLEMMLEHPGKYRDVFKFQASIESMTPEEERMNPIFVNEFAQDWIELPFNVTNPQGREEKVLWNPNLPYEDIGRIPSPFDVVGSAKSLFTQGNPLFKVPIEQVLNKNMFFESPIVREGDNQITSRLKHVMGSYSPYGVGKDFAQKSGADLALHAMNTVSGVKMLSYDYESYKMQKLDEMHKNPDYNRVNWDGIKEKAVEGVKSTFSRAVNDLGDKVTEDRPLKAEEYTDALRPISQSKYDRLSDEEKKSYIPPTEKEAIAYSKKS